MFRTQQMPSLVPSLVLSVFLMASAGLPGFGQANEVPQLRLMAITELSAGAGGHFMTTASINGRDIQVLVDTGATAVALRYEDAEAAGLKPMVLTTLFPWPRPMAWPRPPR